MKKLNYLLLGLAGLAMASCSQEDLLGTANGDGNVNITVQLPGDMATRADLGDGLAANTLQYAVYDATDALSDAPAFSFQGTADFGNALTTTLNLNLINGKTYKIAFFAQSTQAITDGVYTFSPENANGATPNVTVNYDKMLNASNNADAYDCFYKVQEFVVSTNMTPEQTTVTLTRPVAQLNWGASELVSKMNNEISSVFGATGQYIQTNVTITPGTGGTIYNQFNLLSGEVSANTDAPTELTFNNYTAPQGQAFPVSGYGYVAMNYVLVPSDPSAIYSVSIDISNAGDPDKTGDFTNYAAAENVPMQANYRTNIYGTLLSNDVSLTVTKDPTWGNPDYNQPYPAVWDGSKTYPVIPANAETPVVITSPSDLAGLADMVNGKHLPAGVTDPSFEGYTFTLDADMDMGGNSLSIGSASRSSADVASGSNPFRGTFDGNGKTISNLRYTADSSVTGDTAVGLFPNVDGEGSVKNITFDNLQIDAGAAEQAGVVGLLSGGATVSGLTVNEGSSITAAEGAGGIVGRVLKSGTITSCENHANITVTDKNGGGIAGAAYYSETDKCAITISSCTNYGNVAATSNGQTVTIGGIVGTSGANIIGCTNNGNVGLEGYAAPAGGIVGYQNSCGSIKNCINNGEVKGNAEVAGIVAFIGGVKYDYQEIIIVSGNTNYGVLSGTGSVGGIIGINRNTVNVIGNTNDAPSITSTGNAAGIIGNGYAQGNPISGGNGYCNLSGNNVNKTTAITGKVTNEIYTGVIYLDGILQDNIK